MLVKLLDRHSDIHELLDALRRHYRAKGQPPDKIAVNVQQAIVTPDVLLMDCWVEGKLDRRRKRLEIESKGDQGMIHVTTDVVG